VGQGHPGGQHQARLTVATQFKRVDLSRRRAIAAAGGAVLTSALPWRAAEAQGAEGLVMTRPIPTSGERLPIVGIGTAVIFDYQNDPAKQAARREVIRTLIAGGGRLIDTAAAYGSAEERVGEIVAELGVKEQGVRDKLFLATKFSFDLPRAEAEASLRGSLRRLRTDRLDLMQAWNACLPLRCFYRCIFHCHAPIAK